ncbi:MAG: hypothetical protein HS116_00185 [Planctomycetes bacterium]|nr:hypothetical protein [Planctomycetota bacterium]
MAVRVFRPGYFRLTLPCGGRERVNGGKWECLVARKALNLCEHVYKLKRHNVRFFYC